MKPVDFSESQQACHKNLGPAADQRLDTERFRVEPAAGGATKRPIVTRGCDGESGGRWAPARYGNQRGPPLQVPVRRRPPSPDSSQR